jgi:hypothetical protein
MQLPITDDGSINATQVGIDHFHIICLCLKKSHVWRYEISLHAADNENVNVADGMNRLEITRLILGTPEVIASPCTALLTGVALTKLNG